MSRRTAVWLIVAGICLCAAVIVPAIGDRLESAPVLHYLQHGLLFSGALLVGLGGRDLLAPRLQARPPARRRRR